ncbi:MAG: transglycosylase SLT domain-containing protein, partial [Schleiferiaceae bacterium]|nr:transglycosylase SLT domain-containing protein [Schleiferiaceae bacterium]
LEINNEIDERYHIEKSTQVACDYLNEAYERFGNWTLAAASYNMGMAGTVRRLSEQGVESYYDLLLNSETARYVYRIAAVKHIHENLEEFGYVYHQDQGYSFPEMDTISVNTTVPDWISWAKTQGITYNTLRNYNPWIQSQQLSNSTNKAYHIWVPSK